MATIRGNVMYYVFCIIKMSSVGLITCCRYRVCSGAHHGAVSVSFDPLFANFQDVNGNTNRESASL